MARGTGAKNAISGILYSREGESFSTLWCYFVPEFITNLVIYSMPILLDAWFISTLRSTATYAALGASNTFLHLIIKIAEAFSVGTVILVGVHNGAQEYDKAGKTLRDSFWVSFVFGLVAWAFLSFFAYDIYAWHNLPEEIIALSIPFMKLRSFSVFLMFVAFAFIGFLRGIKNSKVAMYIFALGMCAFVCVDYVLVLGKFGFEPLGLQGSAIASIMQYGVMVASSIVYIALSSVGKKYSVVLFQSFESLQEVARLIRISIPVILDKAIMAIAYIWLCKMMASMGSCGLASFCVVKDMERFALVPAIACAQIVTFLVSNNVGAKQLSAVKGNTKKVLLMGSIVVGVVLCVLSYAPQFFIEFFDKTGDFTCVAARAFPYLSILAFFDLVQLILSGSLRGVGDVRTVMLTRLCICFGFFIPISWILVSMPMEHEFVRFMLVYGSFYVGNAFMSLVYWYQFKTGRWKRALQLEG